MKEMIRDAIMEKMDIECLASSSSKVCRVVDLGCSTGPNTFVAMQNVIDAVAEKYRDLEEFQVFFNDHASNDFNTLFNSLPPERPYFAAAVPGSFYGQLFPSGSIHLAYSCYSLHWLSKAPDVLCNKGRILYVGASEDVKSAYMAQFEEDMKVFLNARAKEVVPGGIMVLLLPCTPNGLNPTQIDEDWNIFKFYESSLADMINEGLVDKFLVESFKLPMYFPSSEDMANVVERNGCFSIERIESTSVESKLWDEADAKSYMITLRAVLEGVFIHHFGNKIADETLTRTIHKSDVIAEWMKASQQKECILFLVLKRK